jgi:hypothetical protein
MPTRTKDGLLYLSNVKKSWRWGCEILLAFKYCMIKRIEYFRYLAFKS